MLNTPRSEKDASFGGLVSMDKVEIEIFKHVNAKTSDENIAKAKDNELVGTEMCSNEHPEQAATKDGELLEKGYDHCRIDKYINRF